MRALSSRGWCLSLGLLLAWLGTGCASLSASLGGTGEASEKARRLCEQGLLTWPDLARFPADMPPQDYVRSEDLAWLQAHPEAVPPEEPLSAQPPLCEVQDATNAEGDFTVVVMKLQPPTEQEPEGRNALLTFHRAPEGWRLTYWLPEDAQAGATNVPLFSEAMPRPQKLSGQDLAYTREALQEGVQGLMAIRCVITRAGSVINCHTLKPLPLMVEPALKALWGSRYAPVTLAGKPIDVRYTFIFRMKRVTFTR
ncbi:energy transducer TonB [Corallococcus exercitus]|uniref:energy transducer TonB n=1 Tax=Corallococcus exercitus TaxID=2316736 RepID=UPI001ABF82C0|nr:energy transducer TonB [Corallococcus exercitus]